MNAIATAIASAPVKSGRKPARTDYVYTLESTDDRCNRERKVYRTLWSAKQAAGSSLTQPTTRKIGPNTWTVTSSVDVGMTIITRKALVN